MTVQLVFNPFWFDWGAAATAATGVAAVVAAYRIGTQQVAISQRQVALDELSVKVSLLQQRTEVWELTGRFLISMIATRGLPTHQLYQEFNTMLPISRRLFPPAVAQQLGEIGVDASAFMHAYNKCLAAGVSPADPNAPEAKALRDALIPLNVWNAKLESLFAPYVTVWTDAE